MSKTVKLKRSSVDGKIPLTSDLDFGEIGINTYNGKMFIKRDNGVSEVVEVGPKTEIKYISANHTTAHNELVVCDTAGTILATGTTAYTITLPATPADGDLIRFMDGSGNAQDRPVLINRNTQNIDGQAVDLTCDVSYFDIKLVFNSGNWSLGGK